MHNSTSDISDEVIQKLNDSANRKRINKFRGAFNKLSHYDKEYYYQTAMEKLHIPAMRSILSTMEENEAIITFNDLLEENKDLAFNTLDSIRFKPDLFRTLSNELDSQQKEDYKVYLETKVTARVRFIPRNFYSNNKEGSSKLRIENSNTDSLDNEPLRKRVDSNEFSALNPASFFPSSVTLEEMVDKYEFDTRDPISDFSYNKKNQLCSQTIYWITGKQPSSNLQYLALKGYNKLTERELEEICTGEPAAKRQRIL
ncbi:MAG: hypothetical protein ACEY3M_13215 [Wolbachia sp.]